MDGTYHHVTAEHLPEHINKYGFCYNHRKDEHPMFVTMLEQVAHRADASVKQPPS